MTTAEGGGPWDYIFFGVVVEILRWCSLTKKDGRLWLGQLIWFIHKTQEEKWKLSGIETSQ